MNLLFCFYVKIMSGGVSIEKRTKETNLEKGTKISTHHIVFALNIDDK